MHVRVDWRSSIEYTAQALKWLTVALVLPLALAVVTGEDVLPFAVTLALTAGSAVTLGRTSGGGHLGIREAVLMVVVTWCLASVLGAIPYVLAGTGTVAQPVNALFESTSGFTTTGATVMADISMRVHSPAVLMWRQETQWIGGMGIVVLTVAVLPEISVGGLKLINVEAPGPRVQKLTPRIVETARALWKIYVGITLLEVGLLFSLHVAGLAPEMTLYMALAHGFTTLATGGFSPAAQSVAAFSAAVQWAIIPFMAAAGVNFALFYRALDEGVTPIRTDPEFRFYLFVLGSATVLLAGVLFVGPSLIGGFVGGLRHALFQTVSIVTTTGYASLDFNAWSGPAKYLLVVLMFLGGSAGSTGSAIKMIRWLVVGKSIRRALFTTAHPAAVSSVRVGGDLLEDRTIRSIHAFVLLYFLLFFAGTLVVFLRGTVGGHDLSTLEAMSSVAATLGNVGPGVGVVGPMDTYLVYPAATKLLLASLMLLGRLEILTILVLFTEEFWRV